MPGPFLAGQRLTAGQLNDAIQKTLTSVEVGVAGALAGGIGATEVNIPKLALGPVALVAGGLYHFDARVTLQQTVASDGFMMRLRRDTALTGTVVSEWLIYPVVGTSGNVFFAWDDFISTIAEPAVNYFVSFKRGAGTGTLSVFGQFSGANRAGVAIRRTGYSSEFVVVT